MGDDTNENLDPELLRQIEKILNPTGDVLPPGAPPNLEPIPGTEKEQHLPYKDPEEEQRK